MNVDLQHLSRTVQHNCHISDAHHAAEYPLCIYLLKMREYFRWEKNIHLGEGLDQKQLGQWLTEREIFWEEIASQDFQSISIDQDQFDPFQSAEINAMLEPESLVYSAGIGIRNKPYFFLAKLGEKRSFKNKEIIIAQDEYARELTAPPAMSQGDTIYIRFQSLRRMVWEKMEEWMWHKNDSPMGRLLASVEGDALKKLDNIAQHQMELLVQHEIGETLSGEILGSAWQEMIIELPTKLELAARAVRDNFADCQATIPYLLKIDSAQQYHFYMANLSPLRKQMFPSLVNAYEHWHKTRDQSHFSKLGESATQYWREMAEKLLGHFRKKDENWQEGLSQLLKECVC